MIVIQERPYFRSWSGNAIHYKLFSVAAAADQNIYFDVRVYFKTTDDADFRALCDISFTPVAGVVKMNLQDILHAHLLYQLPIIADDHTVSESGSQSGEFYITYREITPGGINPPWDETHAGNPCHIFKGGLHPYQFKGNNFFSSYMPGKKPFYTWQRSGIMAGLDQRMFLTWINLSLSEPPTVEVRTSVKYTDGTTSAVAFTFNAVANKIYYIPSGAAALGLAAIAPAKKIWWWEISLHDTTGGGDVELSETFRYMADNRNDYSKTDLLYRNSLGGLDTMRIRGIVEPSKEYSFAGVARVTASDYFSGAVLPTVDDIENVKETQTYKGDIGHVAKEDQDRFRDAFLQRQVYQIIGARYWPVKITTSSNRFATGKDKRFTLPIEWMIADGGALFYTPSSVDLGTGGITTAIFAGTITAIAQTILIAGATATVSHDFTTAGTGIDRVEYRVIPLDQAITNQPWIASPVGVVANSAGLSSYKRYTIQARAVSAGGERGAMLSKVFYTTPGLKNSKLENKWTTRDIRVFYKLNSDADPLVSIYPATDVANVMNVNDKVSFDINAGTYHRIIVRLSVADAFSTALQIGNTTYFPNSVSGLDRNFHDKTIPVTGVDITVT